MTPRALPADRRTTRAGRSRRRRACSISSAPAAATHAGVRSLSPDADGNAGDVTARAVTSPPTRSPQLARVSGQLQASRSGKPGDGVDRARRRRADTEQRSERRIRLAVHRWISDAGRLDACAGGAVVGEALAEFADRVRLLRGARATGAL